MIAHIQGKMIEKTPTALVVETGGVGFQLLVPLSSSEKLGEPGEVVKLLTYLHVREDVLQLYGFLTVEERHLFQLLISISGVGPKLAQGILSGIEVSQFKQAVRANETAVLNKIPGVGKKTAERLVVELRDKVGLADQPETGREETGQAGRPQEEAILALLSLGYKRNQAEKAVHSVAQEEDILSVEALLRQALTRMNR